MPKSSNKASLLRWLLEKPVRRLVGGLLLPLALLIGFVFLLMLNPAAKPPRKDGRIVIRYWEKWSGFEGEAATAVVDAFNRRQNKIRIELTLQGDIEDKVKIATTGGNPPDLAGLYSQNVAAYAFQNALMPLDDLLKQAGIGESTYVPVYWNQCQYAGHTWALPTTPAATALHWNKDLFREAGLDPERPPRTIAELDSFAEILTKYDESGEIIQMGFMPNEPGWWPFCWVWWFGGELWDGKSRITATSKENIKAFEWILSYAKKYGLEKISRFKGAFGSFSTSDNAFMASKVAMELQGVWMANFIHKYAPNLDWGAAAFPSVSPGLQNVTACESDVIGIPKGARHPKEAFEFLKFLATPEGLEILCLRHQKHSPLRKTSPDFIAKHPNPFISLFIDLSYSPNACSIPKTSIWMEYSGELRIVFDRVWTLSHSPESALKIAQERMQRRLDYELKRAKYLYSE